MEPTVTPAEAIALNFEPITMKFGPRERHLQDSLTRGLGAKEYLLVQVDGGIEVWRPACELHKCGADVRSVVRITGGVE